MQPLIELKGAKKQINKKIHRFEFNLKKGVGRDFLFLTILLTTIYILGITSITEKSVVYDEPSYLGLGYYIIKTQNFMTDIIISHPPLSYYINSIPFYILDITGNLPEENVFSTTEKAILCYRDKKSVDCFDCQYLKYAHKFLYSDDYKGFNILYFSRITMLTLLLLTCLYFYVFTKKYFGFETSCILTTLLAFNPNILAHSRLVTIDITVLCFNFISFYYFVGFIEKKNLKNAVKTGLSLGLALITKVTNWYLIAVYLLLIIALLTQRGIKVIKKRDKPIFITKDLVSIIIILSITIFVINSAYFFNEITYDSFTRYGLLDEYIGSNFIKNIAYKIPIPISDYYIFLLDTMQHRSTSNRYTSHLKNYINSNQDNKFRIQYWTTTILIKTPEASLILGIISILVYIHIITSKITTINDQRKKLLFYIIINISIFLIILIKVKILIGIRLILLIFPYIFLLFGEPIRYLLSYNNKTRIIIYILTIASIMPAAIYHPHYISYFNQLIGGPENGYKYLTDSDIDWGQDIKGLKKYMDENEIKTIKLSYWGREELSETDLNFEPLPFCAKYNGGTYPTGIKCGPVTGRIAISVNNLIGRFNDPFCYVWLQRYEPDEYIGYSILIYNLTEEKIMTGL